MTNREAEIRSIKERLIEANFDGGHIAQKHGMDSPQFYANEDHIRTLRERLKELTSQVD